MIGKSTSLTIPRSSWPCLPVCQWSQSLGIGKGDRVIIYMPMSIEAVVAMQGCARIGATHSVVFGGFSAKSLHERIH